MNKWCIFNWRFKYKYAIASIASPMLQKAGQEGQRFLNHKNTENSMKIGPVYNGFCFKYKNFIFYVLGILCNLLKQKLV